MATVTLDVVECTDQEYSLFAEGASYTTVGLQMGGPRPLGFIVATSFPTIDATNFDVLSEEGDSSVQLSLSSGDNVYVRALDKIAYARGYGY
jgi:hypothetical protein